MASDKQKRKDAKRREQIFGPPPAPGGFRHRDGDRRRRGGPSVDQALRLKRLLRESGSLVPSDEPDDDDGDDDARD